MWCEVGMLKTSNRLGNVGAMLKVLRPLNGAETDPEKNRQLLADFCRLVGTRVGKANHAGINLPPRVRETLSSLLAGASEKQIARAMGVSQHTVHAYVKQIYKHYSVCSRSELLARWVRS